MNRTVLYEFVAQLHIVKYKI